MYSMSMFEEKENKKLMFNSQLDYSNSRQMKDSATTQPYTVMNKSEENLHVLKLESRALEQLRKLEHQKFQIVTLTEETEQLMKLCDEQKSYIKSVNVDMMRQQYEEEIKVLCEERDKLMNLIAVMKEEKQLINKQHLGRINCGREDNELLSQKIQSALIKKQELLKVRHENNLCKEKYLQTIQGQQDRLHELRHIERKVVISLKQLQTLKTELYQA